jgi:predicted metal-binding protein
MLKKPTDMISNDKIESILINEGLSDYKWINPKEIIVSQWVRVKCTFGCSEYGLGTCPPNTPSVGDCDRFFKEYERGLIIRLNIFADRNSYPSDWSREMTSKLLGIERDIFMAGFQKVFLLNQASCYQCKDCSKNRIDCKDKAKSRPSPESFAVDVYQTVRNAGLDINVISDNPAPMNRIAILLIE